MVLVRLVSRVGRTAPSLLRLLGDTMTDCPIVPLKNGDTIELSISALVSDGRGLGRHEGLVVLAEGALPGQTVRVQITAVQRSLAEGETLEVVTPSQDEQVAPCPHAAQCGGCAWQSLPYERQLFWKERVVRDALERVGKIKEPPVSAIVPSPQAWGYRNKMEFAFGPASDRVSDATKTSSTEFVLGLRERGSRRVVDVTGCLLQSERTMRVLGAMRTLLAQEGLRAWEDVTRRFREPEDFREGRSVRPPRQSKAPASSTAATCTGQCRFLVVREPRAGGCMVELILGPGASSPDAAQAEVLGRRLFAGLRAVVSDVTGFVLSRRETASDVAYGEQTLFQEGQLVEQIGHIQLSLGHNAFFQVNTPAAELLYAEVERLSGLASMEDPTLWDVYSGVGSIGFYLARHAKRIVAIEEMQGAVRCARSNAKALQLEKYKVEAGEARSVLGRLAKVGPRADVVVLDPPRAGIDTKLVQILCSITPKKLIYVSCNPATLARDAARLATAYTLVETRPVDLFPQSPHVESVSLFERKA
ncbi:MAG: class I SAM-dependent RNA methyltransferase [Bilophila sp.]